jgi:hypothetical protein
MGTPPTMICRVEAMSEHSTGGPSAADHPVVNAAPGRERQFVFGYGSLVAEPDRGHAAILRRHRRIWGVAMDNSRDLSGYKSYRLRTDGSRPQVFVAFLDIEPDPASEVTGLCMPVDERELRELDRRERNYRRIDVTAAIAGARGRVWAYSGSEAGRARLRDGLARGRAAVSREYLDGVLAGIAAIAPDEVAAVERSPGPAGLVVMELDRVEIAPASAARAGDEAGVRSRRPAQP